MSRTFDPAELGTGATVEQIEAACERRYAESVFAFRHPWKAMSRSLKNTTMTVFVRDAAQYLVPPGYVIAPVDDVLTPEQRAAVGRYIDFWSSEIDDIDSVDYVGGNLDADFAILRAIADGGTK